MHDTRIELSAVPEKLKICSEFKEEWQWTRINSAAKHVLTKSGKIKIA